jgi:hypothetical protein
MKKGCFIRGIFILTIVTGVAAYLVQTKYHTLIEGPGKKYLSNIARKDFDKNVVVFKNTPEKDSLKALLDDFFRNKFVNFNNFNDKMFAPLNGALKKFSADSILDKNELNQIKNILENIENEGSTKDRD